MWSHRSRCFVRIWNLLEEVEETGRPLLRVKYRFALEKFHAFTDYSLFYYDAESRAGVRSVSLVDNQLQIVLKQDPRHEAGHRKTLVSAEVKKLGGGVLVLTFGLVCSLHPEDDQRREPPFQGRLYPWLDHVSLPSDYRSAQGDRLLTASFSRRSTELIRFYDSEFESD